MKTVAHTPIEQTDTVGRLHLLLSSGSNDVRAACLCIIAICNTQAWTKRGFKSLADLIKAPFHKGGLASTVGLVWAVAMTSAQAKDAFLANMPRKELDEATASAVAKVELGKLRPKMTKAERVAIGKHGAAVRWGSVKSRQHAPVNTAPKRDQKMGKVLHRAGTPTHPKHADAKTALRDYEDGRINKAALLRRAGVRPDPTTLEAARSRTRALTPAERQQFFDWLVAQGAVLSLVPNPAFAGFTDGRKKPDGPVA